jgi:two-component system sensor histidine kinase BaeS
LTFLPHTGSKLNHTARLLGGAGLGLAIVRELTEAMGGSAAVENLPGSGARFTVPLGTL